MAGVEVFRRGSPAADSPAPGLERRRVSGVNVMVQDVRLAQGAGAPMHAHENEQIALILDGRLKLVFEDVPGGAVREVVLEPGDVAVIPPNLRHTGVALSPCRLVDVFSPPSETTGVDLPADAAGEPADPDGDAGGSGDGP